MADEFENGLSEKEILSKYSEGKIGCPYTKAYTLQEARSLFTGHNFDILHSDIYYNVYDTLTTRKVKFNGPKNLGWHIAIKAQKWSGKAAKLIKITKDLYISSESYNIR